MFQGPESGRRGKKSFLLLTCYQRWWWWWWGGLDCAPPDIGEKTVWAPRQGQQSITWPVQRDRAWPLNLHLWFVQNNQQTIGATTKMSLKETQGSAGQEVQHCCPFVLRKRFTTVLLLSQNDETMQSNVGETGDSCYVGQL